MIVDVCELKLKNSTRSKKEKLVGYLVKKCYNFSTRRKENARINH